MPRNPDVPEDLTRFLNELGGGKASDTTRLMPVVLEELEKIAQACFRSEQPGNTLQATALVGEAYLRLFDRERVDWQGRKHFFAVAAKAMRNLLVDHARARKRHAEANLARLGHPRTMDQAVADASGITLDLIDLDAALDELADVDERRSRVVELRYFGGLEFDQIARMFEVSVRTIERDWRAARAWLKRRLEQGGEQ